MKRPILAQETGPVALLQHKQHSRVEAWVIVSLLGKMAVTILAQNMLEDEEPLFVSGSEGALAAVGVRVPSVSGRLQPVHLPFS